MFSVENIVMWSLQFGILFGSIVLHEISHGYAALVLGDTTAKDAGRLSLNPFRHVDRFGTVILPALMLLASGGTFAFGYAKPVPINPYRFANRKAGLAITGAAGPATNVALGVIFALAFRFFAPGPEVAFIPVWWDLLFYAAYINLVLAFFNLIPIPPLDGSRVLQRFLPETLRAAYHKLEPYGFVIIMGIAFLVPGVLDTYLAFTARLLLALLIGVQFG